ncbi:MAG: preQ(0) biosynthesis protein QueC [Myxococcaceae bacterium]|nr:preQ(0) biosynthesis protein QueC [Myxococcaceae bacterium]
MVLLSGGVDSATAVAIARAEGFEVFALTARYGQRHRREVEAARRVAAQLGVRQHLVVDVDPGLFGGSSLVEGAVSAGGDGPCVAAPGPPATYVPARNTVLLSMALAWAESLDARDIFIGANALDREGYPDCRPEFLTAFERIANLGTREAIGGCRPWQIHAPLAQWTKAGVIARGRALGVDYALTWTCYAPTVLGSPCSSCDACLQRAAGFRDNGIEDPMLSGTTIALL